MALVDDLRQLSEQVRKRQPHIRGEEATKQALILPFLQVLGYDIYDPTEVRPEYVADFAIKKAGQFEKVDYAVYLGGAPAIFIECKAVDQAPEDHSGQLARYFNATPTVKCAVVTNGLKYRFFTDLRAPNMMDAEAFFEFDILGFSERDIEILRPFAKDTFSPEAVHTHAQELIFVGKVTSLIDTLLRNPSENFVRYLLKELDLVSGPVTARVVERFIPIVKKAIQTTLLDMMTKSLQHQIAQPAASVLEEAAALQQPAPSPPAAEVIPIPTRSPATVETTEEELEIFRIASRFCGESVIKMPVRYKDTGSYFVIHCGRKSWWFLRLFTGGRRKSLVTRLPLEQATLLAPGFEVEAAPDGIGRSRVYIAGASDVERLRALVMVAFEEEAKRHEGAEIPDQDEDESAETASAS